MIMVHTNRHSSALNASPATLNSPRHFPIMNPEPVQHGSSSPTSHRRPIPSPFSSRPPAFASSVNPLASHNHNNSSNLLAGLSRTPSFSSTAAKFKYLSKYRSRRLSQDSLTDLSPSTHPDLDTIPHPSSAPSCPHAPLKLSSPESSSSHRSSIIFLGRSTKPSALLSSKPSKEKPPSGHMASSSYSPSSSKPDPNQSSSFSLRLRLLSNKTSAETQSSDNDNRSSISRYQSEHTSYRPHRPEVLKLVHSKVTKTEVVALQSPDSDELEAIRSPTKNDFRTAANPTNPYRPLSTLNVSQASRTSRASELSRSSSSPDLNFTPCTFSHRPSQDSLRSQTTVNSFGSPKRSKPPPPIKVPHPPGSIYIAVESDASSAVPSKIPTRHFYSSSESIGQSVRRFAGAHWSTSTTKKSHTNTNGHQTHESLPRNKSRVDSCEDLTASSTSPRSVQISISNSSLVGGRDKFPVVVPLQPAPRRPSCPQLSTDSKGGTLPLLISKHSRSLVNPAPFDQKHLNSYSFTSEGPSINTSRLPGGVANSTPRTSETHTSFRRISHGFQSPLHHLSSAHEQPLSPRSKVALDPPERHPRDQLCISPALILFPRWEEPVSPSLVPKDSIVTSGKPSKKEPHPISSKKAPQKDADLAPDLTRVSDGTETGSVTSFDIRSFPLRLDTTYESLEFLPAIAIPEPIRIPQIEAVTVPSLSVTSFPKSTALETLSKFSSPTPSEKLRPLELNDFSLYRSGISNSSAEGLLSANRIFTPLSTSPSNFSSSGLSRATSQSIRSPSSSSTRGQSRGISVDDFYVNISSNVLMDFSRRKAKKMCRPRSMSEYEPSRDEMWTSLFGTCKDLTSSQTTSPYSAEYPLSALSRRTHSPRPNTITTVSIEQLIRESTPAELNKIVQDALKAYDSDAHRFVVGDINQLVLEARRVEERTKELHLRYLSAARKRQKLFEKHVVALRVFNPDQVSRLGETLSKLASQTDQVALKLLESVDSSSKLSRMCDAHWRAAAAIQLQNLAVKEAQLEAAQCRIEQLESNRARHVKEISHLQSKVDLLQFQARPSSRATDADSTGSGSISSTNAPFGPGSPSSTPRIGHFPFNGTQRHGKIVQSRMRMSSAHSFGSAFNPNSMLDQGANDSGPSTTASTSGEPVSARTAFLSSYGLAHSRALSQEPSETLSQPMNKNDPRTLSSPKTDKTHSTSMTSNPSIARNQLGHFHRSDSTGALRSHPKLGSLVLRPLFPNNNPAKPKRPINGFHLRGNRSSSFGPSEVRNVSLDASSGNSLAPWEVKPRSSSSALSSVPPPSQSATWALTNPGNNLPSELPTTVETCNEFQPASHTHNNNNNTNNTPTPTNPNTNNPTCNNNNNNNNNNNTNTNNVASRAATSSSLLRFPRQAAPPPTLPLLSSEPTPRSLPRRNATWYSSDHDSPTPGPENLSSITLSQLGSLDIAHLISCLEASQL